MKQNSDSMKAAVRRSYGPPSLLKVETVEKPVPKAKQVLIRVHATTVNRTDCANLTAQPFIMRFILGFFKPRKIILGTDFAGEVVAIGKDIQTFEIGDRVFGFNDTDAESQAEYVVMDEEVVYSIPENISYQEAAASLEGAHYAYSFIHKLAIQAGQKILINGATGAIGSALLQFVQQFDVHITASADTKNLSLIQALGADSVYDYTKDPFTHRDDTYDYIFDTVGKSTFQKCKPLLKEKGVYISSELGPYAQNVFYALSTSQLKKKVIFPIPYSPQKTIPYIQKLLTKGSFKPVIDREYDLDNIAKAYKYVLSGKKTGNVIIHF